MMSYQLAHRKQENMVYGGGIDSRRPLQAERPEGREADWPNTLMRALADGAPLRRTRKASISLARESVEVGGVSRVHSE